VQAARDGLDHVADVDRRELRLRAGQRQHRRAAQQCAEARIQAVAGPEDHRRLEQRPVQARGLHRGLRFATRFQVVAAAAAGVERAHLQQPRHAGELAGGDHQLHQLDVRTAEAAAVVAGFVEDADQVDHRVGAR
jgi:hypothetical protein